jgi:hypothetical protein
MKSDAKKILLASICQKGRAISGFRTTGHLNGQFFEKTGEFKWIH